MKKSIKLNLIPVFLIILLGFAVYANSLDNGFVYDDELVVEEKAFLTSWSNLKYFFSPLYFLGSGENSWRPVLTFTYFIDYALYKFNPSGYHLTNVIIHILNGILVYFFFLHLLGLLNQELLNRNKIGFLNIPLLASLLFITHPVQTSVVNAVGFRESAVVSFFFFSSLLCFVRGRYLYAGGKRFFYIFFSLILFFLSLLSMENALVLPLVAFLIDAFYKSRRQERERRFLGKDLYPYIGYIAAIVIYWSIRHTLMSASDLPVGAEAGIGYPGGGLYTAFITTMRIFVSYLKLLIFPLKLYAERYLRYLNDPSYTFFEPRVIFSSFILAVIFISIYRGFRKRSLFAFSGLWIFLTLLPTANIIPLHHPMAERYLYLPSVGFCFLLSLILMKSCSSGRNIRNWIIFLVVIIVFLYSVRTVTRNRVWQNEFTFWEEVIEHPPCSERAYSHLGSFYLEEDKYEKAIDNFQKALSISPRYPDAHHNLGLVYYESKDYDKAMEKFQDTLNIEEDHINAHNNLGRVYLLKNDYADARKEFEKSIELNPFYYCAYNNLGKIYLKSQDYSKAERLFKKAIDLNPGDFYAHNNLGRIYFERKDYTAAEEEFKKAIGLDPSYFYAYHNLGLVYMQKGACNKAIGVYEKAIQVDAQDARVYVNLGMAYFRCNELDKAEESWRQALEINPDSVNAHNNLGVLYLRRGLYDKAEKEWMNVLSIDPNNIKAKDNLKLLESHR